MTITIINDCCDANAAARQITRTASLFNNPIAFIGVSSDLEASGNLTDALDAAENRPAIILVNVAPRNGAAKKWKNGSPFGYFWYKKSLVVATIDGLTLSLVKKLKLTNFINVLDIHQVLDELIREKILLKELKEQVIYSQFRSYDFLPRLAHYLWRQRNIRGKKLGIDEIADAPPAIWWIDNFGNCKTTLLPEELNLTRESLVKTKIGLLKYFPRLKDVPDDTPALVTGSSGLGQQRFIEIVIQGKNAAKYFSLSVGNLIEQK